MPHTPVISTEAKRSGEISRLYGTHPLVAGDLSALRFIKARSFCHPYRRVPPLEMTVLAGSIQSFAEEKIEQNNAPHPVISTKALRSGEISLRNVASPWWQEISRLCVSLEPKVFATYTDRSPLEMTPGWRLTIRISHKKGLWKNDYHFSTALSDGFLFLITSF